jgi:hypothetical protein
LEAATIRLVRGELLAAGLADDAEIDAHLAAIHAGELDLTLAPLISAWGRRPTEHPPAGGRSMWGQGARLPSASAKPTRVPAADGAPEAGRVATTARRSGSASRSRSGRLA